MDVVRNRSGTLARLGWALRRLPFAAVLALGAWAAAPALSTDPYIPPAEDFEQPLAGVERVAADGGAVKAAKRHGEGPVTFRSGVIAAPQRFDLVGIAGELRPLELRARDRGGEWSPWTETANGDPAYFGGADELQLRARGWRPRGTLHYVNVSGTTSTAGSLLTGFRRAVNSAFISASAVIEAEATAATARPEIVTRNQWGATLAKGGCQPRARPSVGVVKAAAIHHTVTSVKYTPAEAPAIVLGICRYHRNGNGWNDIGYNALVDRFGTIYAGRSGGLRRAVVGAHAQGFNAQTTGIASIGTHTSLPISPAALEGFVSYLAWKLPAHGLPARGKTTMSSAGGSASRYPQGERVRLNRIVGHRQLGLTACPGDSLFVQLGQIRRLTQERIGGGGGGIAEPIPPPVTPTDDGTGGALPRP